MLPVLALDVQPDMKVLDMRYTENVTSQSEPDSFPITINNDGTYTISYVLTGSPNAEGTTTFTLAGDDGQEYLSMTAKSIYGNTQKYLKAGDYTLTYKYNYINKDSQPVNINFIIMKSAY